MRHWHVVVVVSVVAALSAADAVRACPPIPVPAVWVGGTGNFSDGAMWNIGVPPDGPPGYLVLIDAGNPVNSAVLLDVPAEVYGLALGAGDSLTTTPDMTLTVRALSGGCTIDNAGLITLASAPAGSLVVADGEVGLTGLGALDLLGGRIVGQGTSAALLNWDNTISGYGSIGGLTLTNLALIQADRAGETLAIGSGFTTTANLGTLAAAAGGVLSIEGYLYNTGGTVRADDGSRVELARGMCVGGLLQAVGTGVLSVAGWHVLEDVSLSGRLEVPDGAIAALRGAIANAGQIALLSAGRYAVLRVDGLGSPVTLSGPGTVLLSGGSGNQIVGWEPSDRLINDGNTISGAGLIGANMLCLTNRGVLDANLAGQELRVDLSGPGTTSTTPGGINGGTFRASGGGILVLADTNLSNLQGVIRAGSGSTVRLENSSVSGGALSADDGTVELSSATLTGVTLGTSGTGMVSVFSGPFVYFDGVTNTGQVSLSAGALLGVQNSLTNSGQVIMSSVSPSTLMLQGTVSGQEIVLSGGGTITMPGVSGTGNTIRASSSEYRLVNLDNTITGAGNLGSNSLGLRNEGVIDANLSGKELRLDLSGSPGTYPSSNSGMLRASNGGILTIYDTWLNNTGGSILAATGSRVRVENSGLSGGTLYADEGGILLPGGGGMGLAHSPATVDLVGATLAGVTLGTRGAGTVSVMGTGVYFDGVTNTGQVSLSGGAQLYVRNSLTNTGQVIMSSVSRSTLMLQGTGSSPDMILSGGGTISMPGISGTGNTIRSSSSDYRLVNLDNTISGAGSIGQNTLRLTNHGVIDANLPGATLTVDLYDYGGWPYGNVNTGTLRASNGGILVLSGTGLLNVGGRIQAQADSQVRLDSVTLSGGTVQAADFGTVVLTGNGNSLGGVAFGTTGSGLLRVETDAKLTDCANTGSLEILRSASIYGTLVNSGTLSLGSGGGSATLWAYTSSSDVYLTGAGNIVMGSSGSSSYIGGYSGANALVNADNTISGAGDVGAGTMRLVNHGTIRANVNAAPLEVWSASGNNPSINTGTMQALGGGRLRVFGFWDNSGGVIEALDSGTVALAAFEISGGTLRTAGSGTIAASSSGLLKDLEVAGRFQTSWPLTLTLAGAIANTGRIELGYPSGAVTAQVRDSITTLSGGGTVALSYGATLSSEMSNSRLLNVDNTIEGSGTITAAMTNRGTVRANVAGEFLYVDSPGYATVNHGLFQAVGGGTLMVRTRVPGTGRWSADGGTVEVDGVGWAYGGLAEAVNGGLLSVMGWITVEDLQVDAASRIEVSGTVQARRLAFALTDEGAWDWSDASMLSMVGGPNLPVSLQPTCEIGGEDFGPVLGGFTGNFHLGGLFVSGGPMRLVDLTDNGNRADHGYGSAEALYVKDLAIGAGGSIALDSLHLYYLNGGDPKQFFPADVDLDGDVDFADYQTLEVNFGQPGTWGQGDFDGDGAVDFADYQTLESCFGQVTPMGAPGPVPEPGAAILLLCGAVAVLRRTRKFSGRRYGGRGARSARR